MTMDLPWSRSVAVVVENWLMTFPGVDELRMSVKKRD